MRSIIAAIRSWIRWHRPITYGQAVILIGEETEHLAGQVAGLLEFWAILGREAPADVPAGDRHEDLVAPR